MSRPGRVIAPAAGDTRAYHNAKYRGFLQLYDDQMAYRVLMAAS